MQRGEKLTDLATMVRGVWESGKHLLLSTLPCPMFILNLTMLSAFVVYAISANRSEPAWENVLTP